MLDLWKLFIGLIWWIVFFAGLRLLLEINFYLLQKGRWIRIIYSLITFIVYIVALFIWFGGRSFLHLLFVMVFGGPVLYTKLSSYFPKGPLNKTVEFGFIAFFLTTRQALIKIYFLLPPCFLIMEKFLEWDIRVFLNSGNFPAFLFSGILGITLLLFIWFIEFIVLYEEKFVEIGRGEKWWRDYIKFIIYE